MSMQETDAFSIEYSNNHGIEHVAYIPKQRRFDTPILMQHGMWHGAWCWRHWQELFAQWGWESHAISLPGHAGSAVQRRIYFCTMGYYLRFLTAEVERLPRKPVLMGHSMGGALAQWYLKYVGDDLPAAVLVAPWESHSTVGGFSRWLRIDPAGILMAVFSGSPRPYIRTPQHAAKKLISAGAIYTPEELHARLSPESAWVMVQHNPPFWFPAKQVKTPLLWLAGEIDAVVSVEAERRSAAYYHADFVVVPQAAHNIMMEHNYRETAETIHTWLSKHDVK
ncbi:MAG TPA: alpha/beta fold hydrolase [Anaerolineaceae bacterium]|nr:alpha/beta fold hydrolase [Anaerolineaceae bacterium]